MQGLLYNEETKTVNAESEKYFESWTNPEMVIFKGIRQLFCFFLIFLCNVEEIHKEQHNKNNVVHNQVTTSTGPFKVVGKFVLVLQCKPKEQRKLLMVRF